MTRYRKKPVEIDAVEWDGTAEGATPIIDWILSSGSTASYVCADSDRCAEFGGDSPHSIRIDTLEGPITASLGDYVIKGIQGEFYPCKPDIFEATYELVTGPAPEGSDAEAERQRHPVQIVDGSAPYANGALFPGYEGRIVGILYPDDIAGDLTAFGAWAASNGIDPAWVAHHPITITEAHGQQMIHYDELQGRRLVHPADPLRIFTARCIRVLQTPPPKELMGGARP